MSGVNHSTGASASTRPTASITSAALRALLLGGGELALLDVREQGVHYQGHPFFACSLPLSKLELMVHDLVPRKTVPLILLDGGNQGLAERAAAKLDALGYSDISILAGGCAEWKATGGELFSGVNVPSKAFGEFVEHHYDTPRVPPQEIDALIKAGRKMVILDSRPYDEYHRMNIPGGIDAPGAELVYRVHDLAPDPDTLVVVNCAGRTRSIIGCQSLRNAGIANEVVALKDGTMGWELAGLTCERGSTQVAAAPSAHSLVRAQAAAGVAAKKFEVKFARRDEVAAWLKDGAAPVKQTAQAEQTSKAARTTFLLDVRTREEFEAKRIAQSRHAPGGQLIQATDEYVGVRAARIVLIDPQRVRSVMTASWLNQMGWNDVFVLEPEGDDGFAGWDTASGPRAAPFKADTWQTIASAQLAARAGLQSTSAQQGEAQGGAAQGGAEQGGAEQSAAAPGIASQEVLVLDLSTSLKFRARHVAGAWWAVRARLDQARAKLASVAPSNAGSAVKLVVLTAEDVQLAQLAAPEAAALWPDAEVRVLEGGNAAWIAAGLPMESSLKNSTTTHDDVWYKPYDHEHEGDYEKHARAYLEWEVALVEQIRRDPAIRFRAYD